jgi:hypothetical protein
VSGYTILEFGEQSMNTFKNENIYNLYIFFQMCDICMENANSQNRCVCNIKLCSGCFDKIERCPLCRKQYEKYKADCDSFISVAVVTIMFIFFVDIYQQLVDYIGDFD